MNPHEKRDPITDNCLDCGATRREVDDGLAPICTPVIGPNRLAIMIGMRELRHKENELVQMRRQLQHVEDRIPELVREIKQHELWRNELMRSIAILRDGA